MRIEVNVFHEGGSSEGVSSLLKDVHIRHLLCEAQELVDLDAHFRSRTPSLSCSVIFVAKERMEALNTEYRSIAKPTDVLSFPGDIEQGDLGDIFICPAHIHALSDHQAGKSTSVFAQMVAERIVHGFLHLCGYSHEHGEGWEQEEGEKKGRSMAEMTDRVLDRLELK